jgi:hypothetical protein
LKGHFPPVLLPLVSRPRTAESARFGVVGHPGEIQHDTGLIANRPTVMSSRYGDDVARTDLKLGPVIHLDNLTT